MSYLLAGRRRVIVSPLVLAEVNDLSRARFGSVARTTILAFLLTQVHRLRFQIPDIGPDELAAALSVQEKYAELDLDLADAVIVSWPRCTAPKPC